MINMLTDREEDYLRALLDIITTKGYAKVRDISTNLKVSPASVVGMMKKLSHKKLVNYIKYEGITLTEEGKTNAEAISKRHKTFREFLRIINVPDDVAEKDAHILEHHLDPRTINQFSKFVDIINNPENHSKLSSFYGEILHDMIRDS